MESTEIQEFLKQTIYCDFAHPSIQIIAKKYKERYSDQTKLVAALFYFVRDYTHYRVGNWNRKASETLHEREGTCTNNANLLVALYRAVNIPAGYGVMEVVGPKYFGPIAPDNLSKNVSQKTKHVYCYVYLNNTWRKCDPSDDEILSINTQHINPQSTIVEWNGIGDSVLKLDPDHILSDSGPYPDIDYLLKKKQRKSIYFTVLFANMYLRFLRQQGSTLLDIRGIEIKFLKWLRDNHMMAYIVFKIATLNPFVKSKDAVDIEV